MSSTTSRTLSNDAHRDDVVGRPATGTPAVQIPNHRKRWKWSLVPPPRSPHESLDTAPPFPAATANLWSRMTFGWVLNIMEIGWYRPLQVDDLYSMDPSRQSAKLSSDFLLAWDKRKAAVDEWNSGIASGVIRPWLTRRLWWRLRSAGSSERYDLRLHRWRERNRRRASLWWALHDIFGFQFWVGGFYKLFSDTAHLVSPLISKMIIEFAQHRSNALQAGEELHSTGAGVAAAFGLFGLVVFASICQHQWYWKSMSLGFASRAALTNAILTRGLELTPQARVTHTNAKLINHVSTDLSRIDFFFQWCHPAWTAPFQIVICLALLYMQIHVSSVAGFGLFLVVIPIQAYAMKVLLQMRRRSMKFTDLRATLLKEVLGSMRITKLFTYETSFWDRIAKIRRSELSGVRTLLILRSATQAVAFCLPVLASVLAFVVYAVSGHTLEPAIIFTALAYFQLLRAPLTTLPRALSGIVDGMNAFERLRNVFEADTFVDEMLPIKRFAEEDESRDMLVVDDASWQWEAVKGNRDEKADSKAKGMKSMESNEKSEEPEQLEPFSLTNVHLRIPKGSVHAVVGPIGSGKSSLLYGIIGEMRKTGGQVLASGPIAYCAQSAWIQNASLRENVLFGREFIPDRYWRVISDACLEPDLELLTDGDMTEIGEKGINLSGGQKARVNLARALYSEASLILLDDPLSAVDTHVAERLFHHAILPLKERGAAVLLVTHALHFLPHVDWIYGMDEGRISEEGTYGQLVAKKNGTFSELIRDYGHAQSANTKLEAVKGEHDSVIPLTETAVASDSSAPFSDADVTNEGALAKEEKTVAAPPPHVLMQAETRRTGQVKGDVYKSYIASGGGLPILVWVVGSIVFMQVSQVFTSYWLVWWQDETFGTSSGMYMGVYSALGIAQAFGTFLSGATLTFMSNKASRNMHGNALKTALHAPMSFFDTTPLGRILGVFGKDMDTIDDMLADSIRMAVLVGASLVASTILLTIIVQYFLPIILGILVCYWGLAVFYTASSRELKRLDGLLRSFVYAHFSESLSGLATIRAYDAKDRFLELNARFIDRENSAMYLFAATQRWMAIRLDFCGALLIFAVAMMAVFGVNGISSTQIGLLLTDIVGIAAFLGMMVRQTAEVENNMNAVERVYQYSNEKTIPQEAAYEDSENTLNPPSDWPARGEISFKEVVMRYRDDLPPVLRGLTLHIEGGVKVGIVGRTGAGKSTLMSILFRLVEISSGSVHIDGEDISKMGLRRLRSALTIIPQEAFLYSGTVRSNLDPFQQHDDIQLWDALRRAHVPIAATEEPNGVGMRDSTSHEADGIEMVPTITGVESTTTGEEPQADAGKEDGPKPPRNFTLDTVIDVEGANLSVGQRSLLSLARALCKDSKIVLMDEATASVDVETDSRIQDTILREFSHKTVLCIAHRLRTVINYDRIVVMDQGRIAEYDTPLNLFVREDSIFRSMCDASHIMREDIEAASRSSAWGAGGSSRT